MRPSLVAVEPSVDAPAEAISGNRAKAALSTLPGVPAEAIGVIRSRTRWVVALATLACSPIFIGLSGERSWSAAFAIGWSLALMLLAEADRRGWIDPAHADCVSAILSATCFSGLVYSTGALTSPLLEMMLALPMVQSVFVPGRLKVVVLAIAIVAVALAAFTLRGGHPPSAVQLACFLALSLFAIRGSLQYRSLREAEQRSTSARLEAVAKLSLSERRRSEVERLAQIGHLAAGVAHEINNPLAYSVANLRFVRDEVVEPSGSPEEVLVAAEDALHGLDRIRQIVTDLKSFSRPDEKTAAGSAKLGAVVGEAVRLASVRTRDLARVEVQIPEGLPPVAMPARELSQVVLNLVVNAADALSAAQDSTVPRRICLRGRQVEDTVRLEVEDNGPGIPDAIRARIFDPFFTTKPPGQGTGLGLALAREYLERAGARIEVENVEPSGARFTLHLRISAEDGAIALAR